MQFRLFCYIEEIKRNISKDNGNLQNIFFLNFCHLFLNFNSHCINTAISSKFDSIYYCFYLSLIFIYKYLCIKYYYFLLFSDFYCNCIYYISFIFFKFSWLYSFFCVFCLKCKIYCWNFINLSKTSLKFACKINLLSACNFCSNFKVHIKYSFLYCEMLNLENTFVLDEL